ncbi:MAG: tetratricopeptide repeat protein [Planctomycetaceae bacterium]|jgi:hypothetical protein|nr:tetratricopeptide repeat protein [Planctomycetaceae bacterium]
MKKIYFNRQLFLGLLFFAVTFLGIPCIMSQEETAPQPPAISSGDPLVDQEDAPTITPIPGGFHIEWSTLTNVGGVRLLGTLVGKVELMFDIRRDDIDKKIEPVQNPEVLVPLADYWIVRGKPARAIPLYRQGLAKDPENFLFQNNLAMLLSTVEGNHAEGLKVIDTALENRRDNVTLLDSKGMILMNDGRANEAVPVLERAVELSCQHPIYCLHLAKALDMAGRESAARNWFDKSRPLLEAVPGKMTQENKDMFDDLRMKYPPTPSAETP